MLRAAVATLAISAALLAGAPTAEAHPATLFGACAARTQNGAFCTVRDAVYVHGATVYLRANVTPVHSGRAEVWRKRPGGDHYIRVGRATIRPNGDMRWNWPTTAAHINDRQPWRFYFRIPNHGRSNPVPVYIYSQGD